MSTPATAMIYTKSRTRLFLQHTNNHNKQPTSTMVPEHLTVLPRTNTRHNDNHIYDFIKKYIVSITLLLFIVASLRSCTRKKSYHTTFGIEFQDNLSVCPTKGDMHQGSPLIYKSTLTNIDWEAFQEEEILRESRVHYIDQSKFFAKTGQKSLHQYFNLFCHSRKPTNPSQQHHDKSDAIKNSVRYIR